MPDIDGLEVLAQIKRVSHDIGVVMITGHGDVEAAVRAMRAHADHFVLKPVDLEALETIVRRVLSAYRRNDEIEYLRGRLKFLNSNRDARRVLLPESIAQSVRVLAETEATAVLILGETGTGKGVVANLIHELGSRADMPFIDLNCAGLTGELIESDLFGHERGAFTDAKTRKRGLFELADGGSLFLDEVGDMPLPTQAKLLKVIETRTFRRVGGVQPIQVDVRIMAATNSDLERAVAQGRFRRDLFFRLNVVPLVLPPLREQPEIVPVLARQFTTEISRQLGKPGMLLSAETLKNLRSHSWPGNVRELRNTIERAILLSATGEIQPSDLPDNIRQRRGSTRLDPASDNTLAAAEARHLRTVLEAVDNNRSHAAEILGIHRSTLISKIKKMGLG